MIQHACDFCGVMFLPSSPACRVELKTERGIIAIEAHADCTYAWVEAAPVALRPAIRALLRVGQ